MNLTNFIGNAWKATARTPGPGGMSFKTLFSCDKTVKKRLTIDESPTCPCGQVEDIRQDLLMVTHDVRLGRFNDGCAACMHSHGGIILGNQNHPPGAGVLPSLCGTRLCTIVRHTKEHTAPAPLPYKSALVLSCNFMKNRHSQENWSSPPTAPG